MSHDRPPDAPGPHALTAAGLLDPEPEPAFDRAAALARRLLDVPVAFVAFADPAGEGRAAPAFCQRVVDRDAPLVVPDARQDPLASGDPAPGDLDVGAYLGVPVRGPDGAALGALCAVAPEPRAWTPADRETLEELAAIVDTEVALREALREAEGKAAEREEAERALGKSEDRLGFVLGVAGLGEWELDLETGVATRSPLHDRIFGYPAPLPAWTYEMFLEHVLPEDRDRVDAAFQKAVLSGTEWDFVCRIRRADGEVRRIAARGRSWLSEHGDPRRMLGTVIDVTDRLETEEALRHSEARFQRLADTAPALLWITEADGRCTFLSQGWYDYTGQTEETGLGFGWLDAVHPDDQEPARQVFLDATEREVPFRIDYRLRRRDGVYRWAIDAARPQFDEAGVFCGFVGSVFDIHDRKQAETRTSLLAATGRLIEQALDYEATLREIARLAVPDFADWCAVDLLRPDGSIQAVAITHPDPERVVWAQQLRDEYPPDPEAPSGVPHVIRTGESEFYPAVPDDVLVAAARDEAHLQLLRSVGFASALVVPMRAGGEVTGAITFVHAESGRRFEEADVETAVEIARRAGAALDMARLHAALREREARYRTLFESIDVGFCVLEILWDADGPADYRFAETNPTFVEQSGLADADGKTVRELVPDFPRERVEVYAAVAETGRPARFVWQVQDTGRWYEVYVTRIGGPGSADVAVFSTDITERRAAEEALRESEARYRTLFESIDVGFCLIDLIYDGAGAAVDYRFVQVNPAFVAQTGLADAEGRTAYELVPGLERHWVETYAAVAETGEPVRYVNGSEAMGRWFDVYAVRVGGAESRRVALLFTDVTERRAAEHALRLRDQHKALLLGLLTSQRKEADPDEILADAAEALGRSLGVDRVGFFEVVDGDTIDFGRGPSWADGPLDPLTGRFPVAGLGTGYLSRIRAGEMHGLADTQTDPLTADSAFADLGVRSGVGAPILRGGEWVAGLYVHHATPRAWTEAEVDVVREVAEQTWNAVARARAEQALRESESRFRLLAETATDVILTVDEAWEIRYVNEAASEVLGYAPDELVGAPLETIVPDRFREGHAGGVARYLTSGERRLDWSRVEVPGRRKDGSEVPLAISFGEYTAGGHQYFTAIIRDVSAQREAEEALRESEARFRGTFENAAVGIAHVALDGTWLHVNRRMSEIVGYTREEFLARTFQDITHPEDLAADLALLDRLLAGEIPHYHLEKRYIHRAGHVVWINLTVAPERGPDGAVDYLIAVVEDISEKKAAESALRRSETRVRLATEAAGLGLFAWTPDGDRVRWENRRTYEIFGLDPSAPPLNAARFVDEVVDPRDADAFAAAIDRTLSTGTPFHFVGRFRRGDGTKGWVEFTGRPVLRPDGSVRQLIGTVADVTADKEAEAALRALNEELEDRVAARTAEFERSNAELDQFAYVASHDLKAPLRAIDSLATWIAEDAADVLPEESGRHLELLRGRVARMEGLLTSLLTYSRAGRQPAAPEPVDTGVLVREVVALVAPPDRMAVEVEGPFPHIETARAPLELVLRNLVGNAIKHHDRPDGRVTVSARVEGEWVTFAVEDDGPGIPPAYQGRVFGLFQTLRPRDEVEGSGMGLAIVKKTVEGRGGRVTLESDGRHGTTFRFTWPLRARATA